MEKEYPSDEVVVLRQECAIKDRQIEALQGQVAHLKGGRLKRAQDKVSELKGNLVSMVSMFREQKLRAGRLDKRVRAFNSVFSLLPPSDGEQACRIHCNEQALFRYFKEFGNPPMRTTTPKEP